MATLKTLVEALCNLAQPTVPTTLVEAGVLRELDRGKPKFRERPFHALR